MSDIRRVEFDTKRAEPDMSETAVLEARDMLETLMKREHRGPSDTWTAARDRTAKRVGIAPAQAKRLWQRWQDMKDVSGGVYRAIRNAYDDLCKSSEAAEARLDAEAERIAREIASILAAEGVEGGPERVGAAPSVAPASPVSPPRPLASH